MEGWREERGGRELGEREDIIFLSSEDGVLKWFEQIDMKHLIKSFILKVSKFFVITCDHVISHMNIYILIMIM